MKNVCVTILVAIVATAASAFAQVDSTTYGGYIMMQAPNNAGKHNFTNRWTVGKISVFADNTKIAFQYDAANNCIVEAEGIQSYQMFNGSLQFFAGATFTATGQITPAPSNLTTEWWHEIFMQYTFIGNGAGIGYFRGDLATYLIRTDIISTAVSFGGLQVLYQEHLGGTIAYESRWGWLVNPFAGVTFYSRNTNHQYSFLNTTYITPEIGVYAGADLGRVEEGHFGFCWDPTPNIRLKAAYKVKAEKTFAEIVYHF